MNLIDIVIIIAVLAGLAGGYARGFWLSLAQYAGALGGVLIGARLAPEVVDWLAVVDPVARQVVAVLVLFAAGGVGGSIGFSLAGPLRRWLLRHRLLGALDSVLGAALSAAVSLVFIWLLALTFARGPIPELARAIQQSTIARALDDAAPVPPAFLARVQQVLSGTLLPPVFTGLEPDLPSSAAPSPDAIATEGVRTAAAATVRVEGLGCGGIATGSGFSVGDGLIVTNAHVVSGTSGTRVRAPSGRSAAASVVFFDAELDLAILRAADLGLPELTPDDGQAGAPAAVIGYPGGGPERISPAVLERRLTSRGRDIYSRGLASREIWIVTAQVRPGNSGGPVVDTAGRFVGVIFASSISSPGQAFALTADEVVPAIREAMSGPPPIETRRFACVR